MDLVKEHKAAIACSKPLPVALIPAYKPEKALPKIAKALLDSKAVNAVVVVDDGSGPDSSPIFSKLSNMKGVHLLIHSKNLGKGAALKTGLHFALNQFPDCPGVVTADADGQHDPKDVAKVAFELQKYPQDIILGSRSFGGSVPLRSKIGNEMTCHVFHACAGQKLSDTQTGLRGIPTDLIPTFSMLRPDGYDYELQMLLHGKQLGRTLREVKINTIYIDDNKSSHFRPLRDSIKIYAVFLRFVLVSFLSALIDNAVFMMFFLLSANIFASQCTGRVVSLLFNYFANKSAVFHCPEKISLSMPRFLLLALFSMLASYGIIQFLVLFLGFKVMIAKLLAETMLFFINYVVQKFLIFKVNTRARAVNT